MRMLNITSTHSHVRRFQIQKLASSVLSSMLHQLPGRYSDTEDRLDIMARMLEWRHIVPTSPDTLTSYPFKMDDPFLLKATPHVLFAGNQPAFGQRLVTGTLP